MKEDKAAPSQEPETVIGLLREARDNCQASIVEEGISADRKAYRIELETRLTAMIATLKAPSQEPVRQYYFQTAGCPARSAHDPNCHCWYDEGTGPMLPNHDGSYLVELEWRTPDAAAQIEKCARTILEQARQLSDNQEQIAQLQAELETERMRLAACGTAALGYFEGCKDKYKSASLDDTLRLYKKMEQLTAVARMALIYLEEVDVVEREVLITALRKELGERHE